MDKKSIVKLTRKWIAVSVLIVCSLLSMINFGMAQSQPNILWIVCEDISPTLSMYGDSTSNTPNLDSLAAHSIIYDNAFATVGVCAPARSSIITGLYPTSLGTMHMRTAKDVQSHGKRRYNDDISIKDIKGKTIIEYSCVVPQGVKCFTEYLRAAGYFCTNNQKTDYQFASPLTAWDQNNTKAHWRNRKSEDTPFFSVFNFGDTHESRLWSNEDLPITIDTSTVPIPPYLPDTKTSRIDIARHYSNIEILDKKIGKLLDQLNSDGLYDDTIIFFYSDHGGPLPRQKRETNDRGLKVPFMIKPIGSNNTLRDDRLISFVDLAPSILSLANVSIPDNIEGVPFLGLDNAPERPYIIGSGDRFDEYTDRVRVLRTDSFLYVRNYLPSLPSYKDLRYRKNIPAMIEMLSLKEAGLLNDIQSSWFDEKPKEELYLVTSDPHNIYNLASDPRYQSKLSELSKMMDKHYLKYGDKGTQGEYEMIIDMWPQGVQPQTKSPEINCRWYKIKANCSTPHHSIAYLVSDILVEELDRNLNWQLYTGPIKDTPRGKYIHFVAERVGYTTSEIVTYFKE